MSNASFARLLDSQQAASVSERTVFRAGSTVVVCLYQEDGSVRGYVFSAFRS